MYKKNEYISSVRQIQKRFQIATGIELKPWRVMHILHHHMGIRYKKVKEISW